MMGSTDESEPSVEVITGCDGVALEWTTVCYGAVAIGAVFVALSVGLVFGALGDGVLLLGTIEEGVAYGRDRTLDLLLSVEHLDVFFVFVSVWFGVWASAREARRLRPLHALLSVALAFGILQGLGSLDLFG